MKTFQLATLASAIPTVLAASGTFNVLSFNVAGLPEWINDNGIKGGKKNAATMIGQKFAAGGYGIIQVQEDFKYHKEIYAADNHPFRTETSGDVPNGSGLNTLSNYAWSDFRRITWDDYIDQGDCLTPKRVTLTDEPGFTFMRLNIADGVQLDFYNLHADAGTGDDDEAARRSNIQQVADYIDTYSAGRPVVVYGDTNCLYSRPTDNISVFLTQNGLRDVWVDFQHFGDAPTNQVQCQEPAENLSCETLDKVFYRGVPGINLSATGFRYATNDFLQPDGSLLSDHNAVLVDFAWST